jgi:aryl-alcohol dehydrogenase-like predicted oxidoreductase
LAQGVLTGKYKNGANVPEGSRAAQANTNMSHILTEQNLDKVEQLRSVAYSEDLTLAQLAIAWILRQHNVASALVGASRPEQLEETIKASGVKLSSDTLEKINEILAN